jgi:hypothetical protein
VTLKKAIILKEQIKKNETKEKCVIKIIVLAMIQSAIVIGIIGCADIEGFSPFIRWSVKAGAIFLLIVASILLIKEIVKIFS